MKVKEFNEKKIYSEKSGSSAVIDRNIKMELNEYGIYEEQVPNDNSYELNILAEYVSPNMNVEINELEMSKILYSKIEGIKYDSHIGYYQSLYAGHVAEKDFRQNASSGGMGTWIFKELFEKELINGVIHVKKNTDKDSPILFKYDISRSLDQIKDGAKTKYYPVEISEVIQMIKEIPGKYAIIGIPSFIMAIRLLAEQDKVVKESIKYTIGLICGHQKTSKFAESLAWQVGITPGQLKNIDFRKKLLDKPANNYGVEMTGIVDGKEVTIIKPTKELLGQNWGHGFFKMVASDFTDDVMNETADVTIGDAWLPEYTKDSKGNNVVVVRNSEIDFLIKEGVKTGRLNLDVVDKNTIFQSQASHYRHTHDELAFRLYKKDKKKEWHPQKRVKASKHIPFLRKKIQNLREKISTESHIIYKEAVELDDFNHFKTEMEKLTKRYKMIYKLIAIQNMGFNGLVKKFYKKVKSKM